MLMRFLSRFVTNKSSRSRHGERGQILPLAALGMVILLGMGALAIDVGSWYYQQRSQQSATDSAAIAGAIELLNEGPVQKQSSVTIRARADAGKNGFVDDGGLNVGVAAPIVSFGTGANNAVKATIIKSNIPTFFSSIPGVPSMQISTNAVAQVFKGTGLSGVNSDCLITLTGSLTINSGGISTVKNSQGNYVCSITADAGFSPGSNTVQAEDIGVFGSPTPSCQRCSVPPVSVSAQPDQCRSFTSCNYLATNGPGSPTKQTPANGATTFQPGEYPNALNIVLTQGQQVTFNPGLYVLDQGLNVSGSGSVGAWGVTLYNGNSSDGSGGSITFGANTTVDLSPPGSNTWPQSSACVSTTCSFPGIGLYQPPANQSPDVIRDNALFPLGMIYAPTAQVTFNGSGTSVFSEMIVGSLVLNQSMKMDGAPCGNSQLESSHVQLVQ